MTKLTVETAAIKSNGKVWTMPRPARHGDIINMMRHAGAGYGRPGDQGFVLSDGRFARRQRARRIAVRAFQVPPVGPYGDHLFSEDMW